MKQLFSINARFHGSGKVLFQWQPAGHFIATAGSNGLVHVFNRNGDQVDEIALEHPGPCLALEWDKDGECLAVLQASNPKITLWDSATQSTSVIDTSAGMKDPTFIKWSQIGSQLAVGTAKGNLLLYDRDSRRSTPIHGKHSKKITCGAWSSATNQLAMGSVDSVLTISDSNGDTQDQTELKYEPLDIQFASQKMDGRLRAGQTRPDTTVSINMGGYTILLYNLQDPDNPVELAFQQRYGVIVRYQWFGDGYMMIGFSEGFIVVISTHMKEIVEELFSGKFHKDRLHDVCFSETMQRAATAGPHTIKMVDVKGWKEIKEGVTSVDPSYGEIDSLQWTSDGQILTVATRSGTLLNFLARMPTVFDCNGTRVAYMSSLREMSVANSQDPEEPVVTLPVSIEPSFVALGTGHVAVGMNNRVWYHRVEQGSKSLVSEREYLSTVDAVQLSSRFAGVLSEGRVNVHLIEPAGGEDMGTAILPARDDAPRATCVAMTEDFCIYGTESGSLEFFYLGDWTALPGTELRHDEAIRAVFPNASGTRVIFIDAAYRGFLYNPVNQLVLPIPKLHESTTRVMWDPSDWGVFVTTDNKYFHTYVHVPLSIGGPQITQLGFMDVKENGDMIMEAVATEVPHNFAPVLVCDGVVTCQTPSGSMSNVVLRTHDSLRQPLEHVGSDKLQSAFAQSLALLRLDAAYEVAAMLEMRSLWLALSGKAMEVLNVPMALKVYRKLGDAGMVLALEQVRELEDKNLLAGHVAMLFADYQQAQELFLASSRPLTALEMQRDLLNWDQALKLAPTLDPDQIPELSLEYGKQLEFRGEYPQALDLYESARRSLPPLTDESPDKLKTLHKSCHAGLTRMTLRTGNLRGGLSMANSSDDKHLLKECAGILEGLKQYPDAAELYRKAEQYDKAAAVLIHTKNFAAVAPLLQHVTLPKLHAQYAKAKEAAKEYLEAARAYERARDLDSVVRLLLDHLNQPERASEVVRQTKSSDGARMVSRYCVGVGDFRGAIEFLLIAKRTEEAFSLAKEHEEVALYAEALGEEAQEEDLLKIAGYYESKAQPGEAGKFYARCGQFHKALSLFLQCGEKMLDEAIKVVGKARNDMLTHTLIDFLMGETDGVPKDPHFIFHLYMALGNYPQAARTAIIIAKQEQEMGNYKVAHKILFQTHQDLREHSIRVPQDLNRQLLLLHSYILVKKLVKQGDHPAAARMLIRVAKNISKFPSHIVPILTSTVIECQRAGLKRSAFEYASMMMRPEYRQAIEPKFKRKIEALVRRPNKEELEEPATACPFCKAPLPETSLDCPSCMNSIPYCVVTGRHMLVDDYSQCPSCKFPCLYNSLVAFCSVDSTCPMCSENIPSDKIEKIHDPMPLLKRETESEESSKAAESKADD